MSVHELLLDEEKPWCNLRCHTLKVDKGIIPPSSVDPDSVVVTDSSGELSSITLLNGQIPIGKTGGPLLAASLQSGPNISIVNGPNSIIISATATPSTVSIETTNTPGYHWTLDTSGVINRWGWAVKDTESGANSGSNLYLDTFDDAGSALSTAMTIERDTNLVTFGGSIIPSKDDTYTLGVSGKRFQNIQTVSVLNQDVSVPDLSLSTTNGALLLSSGDLCQIVTGTSLEIIPTTDVNVDLGNGGNFEILNSLTPESLFKTTNSDVICSKPLSCPSIQVDGGTTIGSVISETSNVNWDFAGGAIVGGPVQIVADRVGRIVTVLFPGVTVTNVTGGAQVGQLVTAAFTNSSFHAPTDIVWNSNGVIDGAIADIRCVYQTTGVFRFQSTTAAGFNITLNNLKQIVVPPVTCTFPKAE